MLREPLKDRARGRWPAVLQALGVLDAKALSGRHCPCPACGGKDRFRFDNRNGDGTWICSRCGAGAGAALVMLVKQVAFAQAAGMIERELGEAQETRWPSRRSGNDARTLDEMARLWDRAKPITPNSPAGIYLQRRRCWTGFSPLALRCVADERYADAGTKPSWHPCMVARVMPSDEAAGQGERAALHRTYLDGQGNKAAVANERKMMGTMPTGAAVRLMPHDELLGIAEGVETALSASIVHGVPVWAALNEGLLATWTPPAGVKIIMIYADNDASYAGQAAAFALAKRLRSKGLSVFVEMPPKVGSDWNDVLTERKAR